MSDIFSAITNIFGHWIHVMQSVTYGGFSMWDVFLVSLFLGFVGLVIGVDWGDD